MEAVVILTCDGFSEILTSNPVSELRRLKILRAVFKSTKELGGEQVYALKMKNGDARDRKSPKMKRRAMKNCKVLGLSAGWIFFIAPSQSLMQLLSIRNLPLHEMTETELCSLLGGKRR